MKRIALLTSGGDAPGMNTAIQAVVNQCQEREVSVFGVELGYEGLIAGRFRALSQRDVDGIAGVGGTILGSSRSRAFLTRAGRAEAARQLKGIDGLIAIGGNGTLTGARLLQEEADLRLVGVPASIDNDIGGTDIAIGVDTALNTIVESCDRISDTARSHRRVFIVEVMGRHCSYLAQASAAALGADACIYRENGLHNDDLVAKLRAVVTQRLAVDRARQGVLIIKSEGVDFPTPRLVKRLQTELDRVLPGVAVRATVLGHLVRGGRPSFRDRLIAGRLAVCAVEALLDGARGDMVAWQPRVQGGTATSDPMVRRVPLVERPARCLPNRGKSTFIP